MSVRSCLVPLGASCLVSPTGYVIVFDKIHRPLADTQIEVVATAGAGFLSISVAFNTITEHATCTVAWAILGAVIVGVISSIQTLDRISWLGWVGLVSILSAVITLTAAVGVTDRPSLAPEGEFNIITNAFGRPTFLQAMQSVSVVVFAYAGTPNFFAFVAEMREPKDFTFSVIASQTFITTVYLVSCDTIMGACRSSRADHRLHRVPLCRPIHCVSGARISWAVDQEDLLRARHSRSRHRSGSLRARCGQVW